MGLTSNPDWASLPVDILNSILDNLAALEDYPTLSEVCLRWEHAVGEKLQDLRSNHKRHCRLHQQVPWLLAPTELNNREERFYFYDGIQGKSMVEIMLPLERWQCEGCSHSWLILINSYKVNLYNPYSQKLRHLPPLESSMDEYESMIQTLKWRLSRDEINEFRPPPRRGVLSVDPDEDDNFVLMMKHTRYVPPDSHSHSHSQSHSRTARTDFNNGIKHMTAFIRSGDKDWSYIELQGVEDIICVNGLFYLLDRSGMLFSCDVKEDGGYTLRKFPCLSPENENPSGGVWESYLVESPEGDFLRVIHKYREGFMVYKLVWLDSRNAVWEEVGNLGDVALFLGESHSISVTASDFLGCQSDSIYFSQHYIHFCTRHPRRASKPVLTFGPNEGSAYIFCLKDKTVTTSLYPSCRPDYRQPLLWISPKLV